MKKKKIKIDEGVSVISVKKEVKKAMSKGPICIQISNVSWNDEEILDFIQFLFDNKVTADFEFFGGAFLAKQIIEYGYCDDDENCCPACEETLNQMKN